jgi:hypothetical protein
MHPLEIVCLITTLATCCTCCIIVSRKPSRKRPEMINLDYRSAFPLQPPPLLSSQTGSVQYPPLSHASSTPPRRQLVLASTLPSSASSNTRWLRNDETLFAESPEIIATMQRTMRDPSVPSCDGQFSWQPAHYNRGGPLSSG